MTGTSATFATPTILPPWMGLLLGAATPFLDLEKPSTGDCVCQSQRGNLTTAVAVEDTSRIYDRRNLGFARAPEPISWISRRLPRSAFLASNADAFTAEFAECDDDFAMAESE